MVQVCCPWCEAWLSLEMEELVRPALRCPECGTCVDAPCELEGLADAA